MSITEPITHVYLIKQNRIYTRVQLERGLVISGFFCLRRAKKNSIKLKSKREEFKK